MKKITFFFCIYSIGNLFAQPGNIIFNDTLMHELRIETELENWFETLENDFDLNYSDPLKYPEIYRKCDISWDGIILTNCGFREKGNSSNLLTNFGKKKPFKISFDEFVDQKLDGQKKINLNNFTNDPSLMHDVVSYKLLRDQGLVASRTSYTKLFINGEFIGLYLVIENVDKTFLENHYGNANKNGNLYKTDRNAHVPLDWQGSDASKYKEQGLKLTTNESLDDWTKLIRFIDSLNNYQASDFKQMLENNFDVHSYLKILAIEKCIRSFDSYWGGGNNYYLYEHPDGKIRWIPWDMNETFQDIKKLNKTTLLTGYLIPTNKFDEFPLIRRIFEFEEYKTEYLENVCSLIQNQFNVNNLGQFILTRHNLVDEIYNIDPNKINSYDAFKNSLSFNNTDEISITHSGYVIRITYPGIFPFIQSQREWAVDQMKGWEFSCSIENNFSNPLFLYPNPADDFVNVSMDTTLFEYSQFELYNSLGQLSIKTDFSWIKGNKFIFSLEEVPSGFYTLMKKNADGSIQKGKLIVR